MIGSSQKLSLTTACILSTSLACAVVAQEFTPDDFVVVSGPTTPRVAYALKKSNTSLQVAIDVATFTPDGNGTGVQVGLAATRHVTLDEQKAKADKTPNGTRYLFTVAAKDLADAPADWAKLRMALAARWTGGPGGADRLRERFLHADGGAPHAALASSPQGWRTLDLNEYEHLVADRKARIVINYEQPMDGKATVVIEDLQGRRIRNLLSGATRGKGPQTLLWDGLDDEGELAKTGEYRWRSLHHPGLRPEHLFSFCNGNETFTQPFGSNHQHFVTATTNGKQVFFAAAMTEGGYAMIGVDLQGKFTCGYNPIHGSGMDAIAVTADDKYLYAAHDGEAWGQHIKKDKPDWKDQVFMSLSRFDIAEGRIKDYPGGKRFARIEDHEWGPGTEKPALKKGMSLGGMALLDGNLYISSRKEDALLIVDASTGKQTGKIELKAPGALTAHAGALYAVSDSSVVRIDPAAGRPATLIASGTIDPRGLALDEKGQLYVTDAKSNTVQVYDANGKLQKTIGKPGGAYTGAYDAQRMVNPRGIAVAGGRLWVAEDRQNPKRALAWDLAKDNVVLEKFGNPPYGSPNAGFDDQDHTQWLGHGCRWKLDFEQKTATPLSVLGGSWSQMHYKFLRRDGRTYLIGLGGATTIGELRSDGTLKDLALISSTHRYCFQMNWNPPETFIEAFNKAYPDKKGKHGDKGPGVLWVDANGDGRAQTEEYDFSTTTEDFAGGYWGHDFNDLTIRIPARVKGRTVIATLKPEGYHPSGAPRYPKLNDACATGVPVDLPGCQVETSVDRFGNLVCNSDPWMKCFAPDGKLLWRYANRWSNVHGSHQAPLPETGVLQGSLFMLGFAPMDEQADLFIVNGNHGRFFALTSDGLYFDEMFKDVRLGGSRDALLVGGECFGGYFGRSEKDKNYYLQTGGDGYRLFRLNGIQEAKRATGTVQVTPEQLAAAERNRARKLAEEQKPKDAVAATLKKAPNIDGKDNDWPKEFTLSWDRNGRFPVKVRCAVDAANLYLFYEVQDESPWTNNGKDWTTLFKTGDSVDLQLGTNTGAPADRRGPVPGDLRLLIAPSEGQSIAVLYQHRVPGAKNPVTFTCPWRSETVDVVRKVDGARIAVTKENNRYRVEASIPLADLGLKDVSGKKYKVDFGVIYGDPEGTINQLRSYWSNSATGLVNDVPGEIMLSPNLWGSLKMGGE